MEVFTGDVSGSDYVLILYSSKNICKGPYANCWLSISSSKSRKRAHAGFSGACLYSQHPGRLGTDGKIEASLGEIRLFIKISGWGRISSPCCTFI